MKNPRAMLAMAADLPGQLFDAAARARLQQVYDIDFGAVPILDFAAVPDRELAAVEVLLTGWESPRVDPAVLDRAPRLRAVLHAAGTVKYHLDPACWARGIEVSSAAGANSVPVAEYSVAMILLAAKGVFSSQLAYRQQRGPIDQRAHFASAGAYRRPVGLVGASRVGRRVIDLLRPHDLELLVFDPYLSAGEAVELGVTKVELDDLLLRTDVVSLHAPLLPGTRHLIDRRRLALLRDGATLINTARGGLIDHPALVEELVSGRIWAVLDTTDPYEPPAADSPLFDLPNVLLTPHVAGALGNELFRLGDHAVDEALRIARGEALIGRVSLEDLERIG